MTLLHDVAIDDAALAACCRRYGVQKLWLFGSILRDDFRLNSDVDVLIDLPQPIGLFHLGGLQAELADLFDRPVHVTTLGSVPEKARSELLRGSRLQYGG